MTKTIINISNTLYKVTECSNGNIIIRLTNEDKEILRKFNNIMLVSHFKNLLEGIGLSGIQINGYHYLQYCIYPDIIFDVQSFKTMMESFEDFINSDNKTFRLVAIKSKKIVASLQEDLENGY